jgi:hypothetical protein
MKFTTTVGTDYLTVTFEEVTFKTPVWMSLFNSFERIGGKVSPIAVGSEIWVFPDFVTELLLKKIIRNTCFVCGGFMQDSHAIDNKQAYSDDFGDDAGRPGTTTSKTGQSVMKQVRKCRSCGHSHT